MDPTPPSAGTIGAAFTQSTINTVVLGSIGEIYSKLSLADLRRLKRVNAQNLQSYEEKRSVLGTKIPADDLSTLQSLQKEAVVLDQEIGRLARIERQLPLPRRPLCVGRATDLKAVQQLLENERLRASTVSIEGFGGIGKTVVAKEIAHLIQGQGRYDKIIWMFAKRSEFINGSITPIDTYANNVSDLLDVVGEAFGVDDISTIPALAKKVAIARRHLSDTKTLVIIDNLETVADFNAMSDFLADLPNPSRALCTSRRNLLTGAIPVRLTSLGQRESCALSRAIAQEWNIELPDDVADAIYEATHGVPLAINLVMASLCHQWPGATQARQRINALPSRLGPLLEFAFSDSFTVLGDDARRILKGIALFHERTTPLRAALPIVAAVDELAAERAFDQLRDLALIEDIDKEVTLHPFTRAFVRTKIHDEERHEFAVNYAELKRKSESPHATFVFTRDFEMKEMSGAEPTVLDLAFSIHTQVGLRFESALVDNQPSDGHHVLKNGNVVEIRMAKSYKKLDEQWLSRVTKRRFRKRIQSVLALQGEGQLRAEAKIVKGNALSIRARYSDASKSFYEALLMTPESTWALNRYAQSLRVAGDDELAREVHEAAFERDKDNAFAACGIGIIHYVRGNDAESEQWFRKALERNRNYVNAMFGLARVCLASGRPGEAHDWLGKAQKVQPGLARIALFRSLASAQMAKADEAKETLETCLRTFDLRQRRRVPEGSHGLYNYAFALLLANSDNYMKLLAEALRVCPAIGVRREIEVDVTSVKPTALGIFDAFALSKPDSAGSLARFVKWLRQGSVESIGSVAQ